MKTEERSKTITENLTTFKHNKANKDRIVNKSKNLEKQERQL